MAVRTATTQSLESDADPSAVLALLGDPRQLPRWAPAFADAVTGDVASGWQVTKDGGSFALRVPVRPEAGTVDYLREIARRAVIRRPSRRPSETS